MSNRIIRKSESEFEGIILTSSLINNASKNLNFTSPLNQYFLPIKKDHKDHRAVSKMNEKMDESGSITYREMVKKIR